MMKLKKLLKEIPEVVVRGSQEIEITALACDSRHVAPGNLFIAKKGLTSAGARYIPDAVAAGATAFLTDVYEPFLKESVQLIHPDVSLIEAALARAFYQHADAQLFLVGITGTNGKTTTAYLVKYLLDLLGVPCGLIGSIERIIGQHVFPSPQNTPDLVTNYKLFHEMVLQQCQSCVMEVTSHGLDQGRVRGIEFDVALFTHLTQDHLDYHKTMQHYAAAKATLFSSLQTTARKSFPKYALLNADCPWHTQMGAECRVPLLTYGIQGPADLRAEKISLSASGIQFTASYQGQQALVQLPLIGRFNVYNCLAAIGVALTRGFPLEQIVPLLKDFSHVPGRLERVSNARGLHLFVDYAHTEDALKNVLQTVREFTRGRLITVFGCGGGRDFLKRPKMGAIAEALSDIAIVTSDNPRQEDPTEIIQQILSGFQHPQKARIFLDRQEAITHAVESATRDDTILIAGKGHEDTQIFAHQTLPFDDRLIAQHACKA